METGNGPFIRTVYDLVSRIPKGRVMSYGQIAALSGKPGAARIVGGIAHRGDQNLPWQRVVHANGKLAAGFPGGVEGHKQVLENEGVGVVGYRVNIGDLRWNP